MRPSMEAQPEIPAKASTGSLAAGTDSAQEARRRRDRIKLLLTSMTEQANKVVAILEQAQTNEDHTALGYASWTAYVAGEYAGLLADLDRAQRRVAVGELTAAGMPSRAIAEIVGVDHSTVVRDRQVVHVAPPDREDHVAREDDVDRLGHEDHVDRRVTGLDGKSYPVPSKPVIEPGKPRRGSLPDDYWRVLNDLDKVVRRLEKLHADDRFMTNRKTLSDGLHWQKLCDIETVVSSMESDLISSTGNTCQDCDKRILPSRDFETRCKTCAEESQ
jgi:hypothetical protein